MFMKSDQTEKTESQMSSGTSGSGQAYDDFLSQKIESARASFAQNGSLTSVQVETRMLAKKVALSTREQQAKGKK